MIKKIHAKGEDQGKDQKAPQEPQDNGQKNPNAEGHVEGQVVGLGDKGLKLSVATCIRTVSESLMLGRKSLKMELAVCLSIFAGAGKVDSEVKAVVMGVYKEAGYKWETSADAHYKTANRRMNASAALYEKIGQEAMVKWVGEAQEEDLIQAVVQGLEQYEFTSMDEVLDFVGKDSNRGRAQTQAQGESGEGEGEGEGAGEGSGEQEQEQKQKQKHDPYKFSVGRVKVVIPYETTSETMLKLAAKIISAARKKEQEELDAAIARKGPAPEVATVLH